MAAEDFHDRILLLARRFHARLEGQLRQLQETLPAAAVDADAVAHLRTAFHAMAGNAPTLGFARIGAEAKRLEALIAPAHEAKRSLTEAERHRIAEGLQSLAAIRNEENETL